jgi:predicted nucleic acid-binding Zn ribbon protein
MKSRRREPAPLSEIVPDVLREVRPRRRAVLERARKAWREVVGEPAGSRTRVTALDGGVLEVEVASAALKHHLATFRREEILSGLRERLGAAAPTRLRFRVGSD